MLCIKIVFKRLSTHTFQANQIIILLLTKWPHHQLLSQDEETRCPSKLRMQISPLLPANSQIILPDDKHRATTSTAYWKEKIKTIGKKWPSMSYERMPFTSKDLRHHVRQKNSSTSMMCWKCWNQLAVMKPQRTFTGRSCGVFSEEQQGVWCNFWKIPLPKNGPLTLRNERLLYDWPMLRLFWRTLTGGFYWLTGHSPPVCLQSVWNGWFPRSLDLSVSICLFSLSLAWTKKSSRTHHITATSAECPTQCRK